MALLKASPEAVLFRIRCRLYPKEWVDQPKYDAAYSGHFVYDFSRKQVAITEGENDAHKWFEEQGITVDFRDNLNLVKFPDENNTHVHFRLRFF